MNRVLQAALLLAAACATPGATTSAAPPPPPPAPAAAPAPAAPPPDPAPVADGDVTQESMQGMRILVKRIPGAEVVAGRLYLLGGVRNWGKDDAGIETLALQAAANGGTQSLDKLAFGQKLAELGSNISAETVAEYSTLTSKSLTANWDATFALLADAFLHPAMPASEIELQRQRQLIGLKREQEVPDLRLRVLVTQSVFKGHPYENRAQGTLETVARLGPPQLQAQLQKLRETSRMLLIVVGDVDPAHVLDQARAVFASLPRGSYAHTPLPRPTFDKANLAAEERKLPTNYIQALFTGPAWTEPDFAAAMVAMNALAFREFEEVRTKRNLSYAPGAGFQPGGVSMGYLYVTAVDPNTTLKVMIDEARRLQTEPVPEKELAGHKSTFLTGYLLNGETTDGQGDLLARAQIFGGDWRLARTLPERIRAVGAADVQAFARKYIGKLQTVMLGDPARLDEKIVGSI